MVSSRNNSSHRIASARSRAIREVAVAFASRTSVDPMTRLAFIPPTRNQARGRHRQRRTSHSIRTVSAGGAPSFGKILARGPSSACMSWKTRRIKSPQGALFLLLLDPTHAMNGRAKEPNDQLSSHTIQQVPRAASSPGSAWRQSLRPQPARPPRPDANAASERPATGGAARNRRPSQRPPRRPVSLVARCLRVTLEPTSLVRARCTSSWNRKLAAKGTQA
jgi:hypothetical protein